MKTENPFSESKLLSHAGRIFGNHAPVTADIFLTNYCNNRCQYCNYRRWEHTPGCRHITLGDFARYVTRLRELGVLGVILTGGGEPTLDPDFSEITRWLETNGVPYGVNTNLLRYPGDIRPRFLKVSLDAWDETSYEHKRGVRGFQQVIDNLTRFSERRAQGTRLGVQLLAERYDEARRFIDFTLTLPVDYISVRPMESTCGQYYDNPERLLQARLITALLESAHATDGRVITSPKWRYAVSCEKPPQDCPANWSQLAIDELGNVLYCCQRPYDVVGHILDPDILQKKAEFSCDFSTCDYPCRLTGANSLLRSLPRGFNDVEFI